MSHEWNVDRGRYSNKIGFVYTNPQIHIIIFHMDEEASAVYATYAFMKIPYFSDEMDIRLYVELMSIYKANC